MFTVYYQRGKYEMFARFYDIRAAREFALGFVTMCGGNYAQITNCETGELFESYGTIIRA